MKTIPIIVAIGLVVVIIGAWAGWMLAGSGGKTGEDRGTKGTEPSGKTAGQTDEGKDKADGDHEDPPGDPYVLLTGRAEDARLDLAGKDGSWTIPALPARGTLTWIRSWEFRGEASKAKITAKWKRAGENAVVLTGIERAGLPAIAELTVTLKARLELSGAVPGDAKQKSELERLGRQLLFLLRGVPAGEIQGGAARTLGGQPFRFAPLDGTRAVLLAADLVAKEAYPAEPGVLSEVQLTRGADGAFAGAVRVIANRRAEVGTVNVERLELR